MGDRTKQALGVGALAAVIAVVRWLQPSAGAAGKTPPMKPGGGGFGGGGASGDW